MNVNRSKYSCRRTLLCRQRPPVVPNFFIGALRLLLNRCGSGSAVSGVVLIEFAQFLEDQGRLVEAQQCHTRVRQILCHYAGQAFKLPQTCQMLPLKIVDFTTLID